MGSGPLWLDMAGMEWSDGRPDSDDPRGSCAHYVHAPVAYVIDITWRLSPVLLHPHMFYVYALVRVFLPW